MQSGFNIGKDVTLDLIHPNQGPIPFGLITSFTSKTIGTRLESRPITNNGKAIYRRIYHGWEGTFELDRENGLLDLLVAALEEGYYAGDPETYFMITETINNPDKTQEQFRYVGVVLEPDDQGTYQGETKVSQRFSWVCTERVNG